MKIRPLGDRLIVERLEQLEKTSGGIIIPDSAKEKPLEGIVRAAGPGRSNENGDVLSMAVAEGNKVLFGKYAGTEIKINGESLLILKEDDILAIIEE